MFKMSSNIVIYIWMCWWLCNNGILLEKWIISNIGKNLIVLDGVSISMLIIVGSIGVISRLYILNKLISNLIMVSMLLSYVSYDVVFFIISYEVILIRISILVMTSGSSGRKEGIIRLLYYTLFGSIFLIILMVKTIIFSLSNNYFFVGSSVSYILLSIRLFMKFRIFRFLTWLLWALTESNIIGSIILSSLILKVSIYGWYRYNMGIEVKGYTSVLITLGILSIIISSLYSIIVTDIKRIIAYFSVILMSTIFVNTLSNNMLGSWLVSITLSYISSGLFYIVSLLYFVYLSREIYYYRLLSNNFIYSLYFLYLILSNISFRFTGSFLREIIIFMELFNSLGLVVLLVIITVLLTSILSLWLNTRILYNIRSIYMIYSVDISRFLTYNLGIFSYIIFILSLNVNILTNGLYTY